MSTTTRANNKSRFRQCARRATRLPSSRAPLALVLASFLGTAFVLPAGAADDVPIVGRETIIGELIPITGDPIETRSVDLRIGFHRNSAEITESAEAQIRELGQALTSEALRNSELAVYGHTDSSGSADYNQKLSERRANAVAVYLQTHFAIHEERIREARGYGEELLREDLPPGAADQRRVEIVTFHERSQESLETDEGAAVPTPEASTQAVPLPGADIAGDSAPGEAVPEEQTPSGDDEAGTESGYIVIE